MNTSTIATLVDSGVILVCGIYLTLFRSRLAARGKTPDRRRILSRRLGWIGPMVICLGLLNFIAHEFDSESLAERSAKQINERSPKMLDAITRFDRATAGPGEVVTIHETVITLRASEVSPFSWHDALPKLRENIEKSPVGRLPSQGVTVIYEYYGKDGELIDTVKFPAH